jgi:hypothetical protein
MNYPRDDGDGNDGNRHGAGSCLLDAAMEFARQGMRVFPLARRTKVPRKGSAGLHDATVDVQRISEWWSMDPQANIGVRTMGLAVVDLDMYQPRFTESWDRLVELTLPEFLPDTWVSRTGRGGSHYWFRLADPEGRQLKNGYTSCLPINARIEHLPRIDLKCSGGSYVVAPPSVVPAGTYAWLQRGELATAPAWLRGPARASTHVAGTLRPLRGVGSARRVAAICDVIAAAPVGQRNSTLNWGAFRLAEVVTAGMLRRQLAHDALLEAAMEAGLPLREAERTIRSAFTAGRI